MPDTSSLPSAPAPFAPFANDAVPGYPTFLPAQPHAVGAPLPASKFPQNAHPPKLFTELTIRGVTFPNRLAVAPMCMYSSDDGHATDWHLVHLGSMATRGWSNIMVEATAVVPEGRITPQDMGIWSDSHVAPLKRVVDFAHAHKAKIGIQLAHAGRKASTLAPWVERLARDAGWKGGVVPPEELGGWPKNVVGPSEISFHPGEYPDPTVASAEYLSSLKQAYLDAVGRCKQAGFDFIEIHGAHGYLLHEFCSPVSNKRTDGYGGSFENRTRLALEIASVVRQAWDGPLFYRVSASDWLDNVDGPEKASPGQTEEYAWWGIAQTTLLGKKLHEIGVDLYDVSSGGNDLRGQIKIGPGYQVPFAQHVKRAIPDMLVGAVGLITDAQQAEDILVGGGNAGDAGDAPGVDVVFLAREILRNIDFPLKAAEQLGVAVSPAVQYERAWSRMVVARPDRAAPPAKEGRRQVEGEDSHAAEDIAKPK